MSCTVAPVVTELINTGSELLLGRVLNTHQQWLGRQLADAGYPVSRQMTVPDDATAIQESVLAAVSRSDLVIMTGGLGPTGDDRTRELVAEAFGLRLCEDVEVAQHIRRFFESRGRPVPGRTQVETWVPEGATVLMNAHGTAPGLAMVVSHGNCGGDVRHSRLVLLPGPPRELQPMFQLQALPWIQRELPLQIPFLCRTLRTTGLGESFVEARLMEGIDPSLLARIQLGFCARMGEVDVRLVGVGEPGVTALPEILQQVRSILGPMIFGEDDETLEACVVSEMTALGATLAVAESCTGGFVSHRLTNVPGASAVLKSGWITYSNEAKVRELGVSESDLMLHGAVSEPVARQMAEGALRQSEATFAIALTGIAGPGGGTADKPVGTVFIAVAGPDSTRVTRAFNPFDRETFKLLSAQEALNNLRAFYLQDAASDLTGVR